MKAISTNLRGTFDSAGVGNAMLGEISTARVGTQLLGHPRRLSRYHIVDSVSPQTARGGI